MKTQYEVTGWIKFSEEDDFNEGCQPDTTTTTQGDDIFKAATVKELIAKIVAFLGLDNDDDAVELDTCDEPGRVDISQTEDEDGTRASERDLEKWKQGKIKLFYATYSFHVEKVTRETVRLEG